MADRWRIARTVALGLLALVGWTAGCGGTEAPAPRGDGAGEAVRLTILHLSDLSDVAPSQGGRRGGLARVAALRRALLAENPNTFVVLSGDFLSPSFLNVVKVDGERLAGRHMVDVLDAMGLDYATFGGHEFDLEEADLGARIGESRFLWISSNVRDDRGRSLPGVSSHDVLTVGDGRGGQVRIGWIGLTGQWSFRPYARVEDPLSAARREVAALEGRVDVIIALTHLQLQDDVALVEAVPEIDLVLGGHEHENWEVWRGSPPTLIAKSDANALSIYVHELAYYPSDGTLTVSPRLVPVTDALPEDPGTARTAEAWLESVAGALRVAGFPPDEVVTVSPVPLDARVEVVRRASTPLTELLAETMLRSAPDVDVALFNSGSIRKDDVIPAGIVTQDEILDTLPFGGMAVTVDMPGRMLERVIRQGRENAGTGGFLQVAGARIEGGRVLVADRPLDPARDYRVVLNDFLLTGREIGLDYLRADHSDVTVVAEGRDLRLLLVEGLRREFGVPEVARP